MGYLFTILVIFAAILLYIGYRKKQRSIWRIPTGPFPPEQRIILIEKVAFYNALDSDEKKRFENKIDEFLLNFRITGIETEVDETDKVLVAASAVIPIFGFDNWRYLNLDEVLLYPGAFNEKFETEGPGRGILGMVGTGYMEGKMILSKPALIQGFANESDKKNTAIHEFVHLLDMADGKTDGIPSLLLEKQYSIPWLKLIEKKIDDIYEEKSDINPYGGTSRVEFYAVASEYFFERPKLLKQKHPELYKLLEEVFDQDMAGKGLAFRKTEIGRNSPCPCGSGLKFKRCCGKNHY